MEVLIADDHEVVRRGIKDILHDEFREINIDEARNGDEVSRKLLERKWDLILLDIIMPGKGVIEVLKEIRAVDPGLPVLILTAVSEVEYAAQTLLAGANGYITKRHADGELIVAIRKLLAGETYLSGEAAKALTDTLRGNAPVEPHQQLSPRELEIFCLIAKGMAVKEIAFTLSVSPKTVGTYIARIKEKTCLENYVDFARYALQHKLVE